MKRNLLMFLVAGMLAGCRAAPTEVEVFRPDGQPVSMWWEMHDGCVYSGWTGAIESHTKAILLGDKCLNPVYGVEYYRVALVDNGHKGWINGAYLWLQNEPLVSPVAPIVVTSERLDATVIVVLDESGEAVVPCSGRFTISLDGALPQDYYLDLVSSGGDNAHVRCFHGQVLQRWGHGAGISCIDQDRRQGDGYLGEPSSFTVTVTWGDRQIVQHFESTYQEYSNGRGVRCIPETITMTLPISP